MSGMHEDRTLDQLRKRDKLFTAAIESLREIAYDDMSKGRKVTLMQGVLNDLQDALREVE